MKPERERLMRNIYVNREHSWLQFNERVLAQANDRENPLLERCKFFSIFCSNLDEFFMVRVGSLVNEAATEPDARENKTNLTAAQQLQLILKECKRLYREREASFVGLRKALAAEKIRLMRGKELSDRQRAECKAYFECRVLPLLSPMVLDSKHPLVRFENKQLYRMYRLKKNGREMLGVMAVSPKLEPLYRLESGKQTRLVPVEELIRLFGDSAFAGYSVEEASFLRVTRNADFDASVDDGDVERDFDFSKFLKHKVDTRAYQDVVRLEIEKNSDQITAFLQENLHLKKNHIFKVEHYFENKFFMSLSRYLPADQAKTLKYAPFRGKTPVCLEGKSVMQEVFRKDVFLFYPYHSMDTLVRLLDECADDSRVVSIKITIYRLDSHSRIVDALKRASENGKEVTVVIELCARFDEENNLYFANLLQEAGCTIIYGMQNYKVHSKIISVVLSDGEELKYITHLGTGNYNEGTSRQYTDLNIITADEAIGRDATAFFRNLAICNIGDAYEKLLIAPSGLKQGLMRCMDEQIELARAGKKARITAKMNSLTDREMIDKLAEAGQAGVKVDLIVRGICCLLPGIPGKTENIRVISIVGRFLEHSRIYAFGYGDERKIYISSADLMTRNISRRVEIATPVEDPDICETLEKILKVLLSDNVKARELQADGTYRKVEVKDEPLVDAQHAFLSLI